MKILIIQQKMIGDVLTSSILFEALRKKYPGAQLSYLIHSHTQPVIKNNPFIDQVLLYDKKTEKTLRFISFLWKIRKQKYDVVIDVYSKISTAIISLTSGAATRISYKKWYTSWMYSQTFNYKRKAKTGAGFAIENRMLLLQGLSPDFPLEMKPKIYLDRKELEKAGERIKEYHINLKNPLFMISILGSSAEKTYPPEYMAQLLDELVVLTNAQLLLNYIPKQKQEVIKIVDFCRKETKKHIVPELFGNSLREFMALTKHCDALIGNEGGAVNMAKALDVPTFSIFSPQINKNAWSIYENKFNMAVHVEEVATRKPKENNPASYNDFTPNLILPKLKQFLQNLNLV